MCNKDRFNRDGSCNCVYIEQGKCKQISCCDCCELYKRFDEANPLPTKNKIIEYVKNLVNVDLEKYRTDFSKQWERDGEIIVEYREIPRTDWRKVELLAYSKNSRIKIKKVSVWGMMIAYK